MSKHMSVPPAKRVSGVFADVMQLLQIIHLEVCSDSFYINCKIVLCCLIFLLNWVLFTDITEGVIVEKPRNWGRSYVRAGFCGLGVRVLVSGAQVCGFNPSRSRRIFRAKKILSTPSFGGEVKLSVPCRTLQRVKDPKITWKSSFPDKFAGHYSRL